MKWSISAYLVNIGVLLSSPAHNFVEAKMNPSNGRWLRFFGAEDALSSWWMDELRRFVPGRIRCERYRFETLENLTQFVNTRANNIVLTPPRYVRVTNPQADLDNLYRKLVLVPPSPVLVRLYNTLDTTLSQPQFRKRVRRKVKVTVPVLGTTLRVPFAYRSDVWNLIVPVLFRGSREKVIGRASVLALQGRYLAQHKETPHPKRLVVVAEFAEGFKDLSPLVETLLREHDVRLLPAENIERLADELLQPR
jgi:hypothetical protein